MGYGSGSGRRLLGLLWCEGGLDIRHTQNPQFSYKQFFDNTKLLTLFKNNRIKLFSYILFYPNLHLLLQFTLLFYVLLFYALLYFALQQTVNNTQGSENIIDMVVMVWLILLIIETLHLS